LTPSVLVIQRSVDVTSSSTSVATLLSGSGSLVLCTTVAVLVRMPLALAAMVHTAV
jgi:hypothetical protein